MKSLSAICLILACLAGTARADVTLLVAPDYAPMTSPGWPGRGLATEIVTSALDVGPDPLPYAIVWQRARAQHPDKIARAQVDMGFPWTKPDCDGLQHDDPACSAFHFSDPLAEVIVLLFTRTKHQFEFSEDDDVSGRVLCRPAGFFTHDLDRPDRRWLRRGIIQLVQPDTTESCFELLMRGEVDAVAVDEFLGVRELFRLGLTEEVVPLPRMLSEQSLHVIISKAHWRATAHLYRINAGLAELHATGKYSEIIDRHLSLYWDEIKK